MLSEQSNKSLGLRTMELIAIFFVNAIACKKRFCSPIFQFQPEGSCAISTSLSLDTLALPRNSQNCAIIVSGVASNS